MRHETFDTGSIDVRSLSPAQRAALQRRLVREAHAARARTIQRTFARVFGWSHWLRAVGQEVGKIRIASIRRRRRRKDLARMLAMTDYELRDIGISRSEIRGAWSGERDMAPRDQRSF
jgi:uncharacterized protein YjiS (DUF1127 family)